MQAVIVEFESLEESACSETTARSNRFVPANVLYRSSIAGAMLQALLFSRGQNYSADFNNALNSASSSIQVLSRWYKGLISDLPSIAITDALLLRETRLRAEVFNVLYDGTATALGSMKNAPLRLTDECRHLEINQAGGVSLRMRRLREVVPGSSVRSRCAICQRPLEISLGLDALDFTVLRPDPKKDALFPSIREVMTARVAADAHIFRVPGARWRTVFIGESDTDLSRAIDLFQIVLTDLGLGSKHSFRGKGTFIGEPRWIDMSEVRETLEAPLFQPLICRDGNVTDTLARMSLSPVAGMQLSLRLSGLGPSSVTVPAVNGTMRTSKGYTLEIGSQTYLITDEDLTWPRHLQ